MPTRGPANGERDEPGPMRAGSDGNTPPRRTSDPAPFESTFTHVPPGDTAAEPTVTHPAPPDAPATSVPDAVLQRFGDYDLLAEIARGGMGIVYKARQLSLGRIVALKMIRSGRFADDEEVRRFRVEAQAAAHLDHPHIVPVYEVGTHDGHDYYTMGYVEGRSLEQQLAAGPLPPREAADLLSTVAAAIHFAHQKGIIHRDLKPSNVLLAPREHPLSDSSSGRRDRPHPFPFEPRITDFGLARRLESPDRLTITGQVVGTPSYMSPEQAAGQPVGPATDVYSLGALLYCTLTGRPPFRAASLLDTLHQVRTQEPVPPRQINAGVPRDLETICLRCLSKDPATRYASAGELADDLARFLRGETILARRAPWWERSGKWARRRPAAALLTVVVAASVVIGGSMLAWFRFRLGEGRSQLAQQQEQLNQERIAGDALASTVLAASVDMVRLATIDGFGTADFLDAERRAVFSQSIARYEQLIPVLERRVAEADDPAAYRQLLASCHFNLGALQLTLGSPRTEQSLLAARALWRELSAGAEPSAEARRGLATCCFNLGEYYLGVGDLPQAESCLSESLPLAESLTSDQQADLTGRIRAERGLLFASQGRLAEAERDFQAAASILEAQLKKTPTDAAVSGRLGRVQYSLGLVCLSTSRYGEADGHYRRAIEIQQPLVDRVGTNHRFRHDLAVSLTNSGQLRWQLQDLAGADTSLEQAVEEARTLVKLAPSDRSRAVVGRSCYHRASLLFSQQNADDAAPLLEESLAALDAIERDPVPDLPALRQMVRFGLLQASLQRKDHRRAFAMVEQMAPHSPQSGDELFLGASYCAQCAVLAAVDSDLGESDRRPLVRQYGDRAIDLLRQAADAGFHDAGRLAGAPEWETLRQRDDYQEVARRIAR